MSLEVRHSRLPGAIEVARALFALAKAENSPNFTAMKLHKLLHYCQAQSHVERQCNLFDAPMRAWAMGPVVSKLHRDYTKGYKVLPFDHRGLDQPARLRPEDFEIVHAVWERFKHLSGDEMSDRTHLEDEAWSRARAKQSALNPNPVIEPEEMQADMDRSERVVRDRFRAFLTGVKASKQG